MATLVLTTVGTMLGGPIGGAIGALAGQAVDSLVFKPAGRTGPRLADLHVQTSRYGAPVPRLYGTMRVAGTVIWASDLKETTSTSGGGKGAPSVTGYSYSASFAVAVSSRPILSVGRIWADGNLLRGVAGDLKVPIGALRVYPGRAGQAVDPLIAAAIGIDQAPAFRDMAYLVFEDLQLADYGNRIPSLTFEVIADAAAVPVSALASDLLGTVTGFAGVEEPELHGFAAEGDDVGAVLSPLVQAYGLHWRFGGGAPCLAGEVASGRRLGAQDELARVDGRPQDRAEMNRAPLEGVSQRLSVRHFDPARDYQAGLQTAERAGPGQRSDTLDLPALLSADDARGLADRQLRRALRDRRRTERSHGWTALDLAAGDLVELEGEAGSWRVVSLEWDEMAPRLSLRAALGASAASALAGDSGTALLQDDLVQGPTRLALIELPPQGEAPASAPAVFAAATGATAGWRRAALFRFDAESAAATPIGPTAPRAVIGTGVTALPPGAAWMFDAVNSFEVELASATDVLLPVEDDALLRGANLCMLGDEALQFGMAQALGGGRWRLSRLLRGWHGTEWAIDGHEVGEDFVLIEAERLAEVPMDAGDAGRIAVLRAIGLGDVDPAEAGLLVDGRAMLPPAPVHGEARLLASGDIGVTWTRRSRTAWLWRDSGDVAIGEESEAYRLSVRAGEATLREIATAASSWTYDAADLAVDLVAAGAQPLRVAVRQIGTHGVSRPLLIDLP